MRPAVFAIINSYRGESSRLFDAFSQKPDGPTRYEIDQFIRQLIEHGIWRSLDMLQVYASVTGATLVAANAHTDWRNPSRVASVTNSPTLARTGYTFNGSTQYLDTGFLPSASGNQIAGTSQMLGVYERTNVGAATYSIGASSTSTRRLLLSPRINTDALNLFLNSNTVHSVASVTDSRGLTCGHFDGTNHNTFKNGVAGTAAAAASPGSSLASVAMLVGGYNNNGTPAGHRASEIAMAICGRVLTDAQQAVLQRLWLRLATHLGCNVSATV